jgi:hypothetical protein
MDLIAVEAEPCDVKLHEISVLRARVKVRRTRALLMHSAARPGYSVPPTSTAKLNQQLTGSPFFLAGANVQ